MFGEKEIIGIKNLKINKNRISLPPFTFATPNDELFFIFDHTGKHMILAQEQELMANIDRVREELKKRGDDRKLSAKELGAMWKKLSETKKKVFKEQYEEEKKNMIN